MQSRHHLCSIYTSRTVSRIGLTDLVGGSQAFRHRSDTAITTAIAVWRLSASTVCDAISCQLASLHLGFARTAH